MGFNNTITIVSNDTVLVEQISSKLVLLRDLDRVTNTGQDGAIDFLKTQMPNVIILHSKNSDPDALNLIKEIKKENILQETPIIFLDENCNRETIIDAFDSGISDILKCPVQDYELLIRVIWSIQKDEINTNRQTHFEFMKDLGIIQADTGVYTQKYCDEFLKSEFNHILNHKTNACLMLVTPDSKFPGYKSPKEFLDVINKSVRINDSVAIKDVDEFYVFLPKTKLNGVYPVFERINNNLGLDCGANASVIEIKDEKFEEARNLLEQALAKAKEETNALIVASSTNNNNPNAGINLSKQPLTEDVKETSQSREDKKAALQEAVKNAQANAIEGKKSKLFIQTYKQKCKIVFEPVFEKYQSHICTKIKDAKVDYRINLEKTNFVMSKGNICATLTISYGGTQKVRIDTVLTNNNATQSTNTIVLDFVQLNFQKLSQVLEELYIEFKNHVKVL